tara:strand:+ start:562 stop:774 length:213 start_codon:yes stop_codon:yes gene_type:complete
MGSPQGSIEIQWTLALTISWASVDETDIGSSTLTLLRHLRIEQAGDFRLGWDFRAVQVYKWVICGVIQKP